MLYQKLFQQLIMLFTLVLYSGITFSEEIAVPLTDTIVETYTCSLFGKVTKVSDGDTIEVLDSEKTRHKIRLAGIDAPEKKQSFSNAAQKHLANLVAGKEVCIAGGEKDKYQRIVGTVIINKTSANASLVALGYAWHYKKFENEQTATERTVFAQFEKEARSNTLNLWSNTSPIAPWDWRAGKRTPDKQPKQESASQTYTCGEKRFCKQMQSCSEACHYYLQCGIDRLDKDNDGIPCEAVCSTKCK